MYQVACLRHCITYFDPIIHRYHSRESIDFWLLKVIAMKSPYLSLVHLANSCCMKFSFCRKITVSSCWHSALIVLDKSPPFPSGAPSPVRIITPETRIIIHLLLLLLYPSTTPLPSSSSLIRILPQFSSSCDVSQQFVDWTGHRRHRGLTTTNLSSKYNAIRGSSEHSKFIFWLQSKTNKKSLSYAPPLRNSLWTSTLNH